MISAFFLWYWKCYRCEYERQYASQAHDQIRVRIGAQHWNEKKTKTSLNAKNFGCCLCVLCVVQIVILLFYLKKMHFYLLLWHGVFFSSVYVFALRWNNSIENSLLVLISFAQTATVGSSNIFFKCASKLLCKMPKKMSQPNEFQSNWSDMYVKCVRTFKEPLNLHFHRHLFDFNTTR